MLMFVFSFVTETFCVCMYVWLVIVRIIKSLETKNILAVMD